MKFRRQMVLVENPSLKSQAALILINRNYATQELQEWFKFRKEVLEESEELECFYCGKKGLKIEVSKNSKKELAKLATLDHIIPLSKGGEKYDRNNIVIACYRCNQKKADKMEI